MHARLLQDIITDLNAYESRNLSVRECANASCHAGMLEAALYVKDMLLLGPIQPDGSRADPLLGQATDQLCKLVGHDLAQVSL